MSDQTYIRRWKRKFAAHRMSSHFVLSECSSPTENSRPKDADQHLPGCAGWTPDSPPIHTARSAPHDIEMKKHNKIPHNTTRNFILRDVEGMTADSILKTRFCKTNTLLHWNVFFFCDFIYTHIIHIFKSICGCIQAARNDRISKCFRSNRRHDKLLGIFLLQRNIDFLMLNQFTI